MIPCRWFLIGLQWVNKDLERQWIMMKGCVQLWSTFEYSGLLFGVTGPSRDADFGIHFGFWALPLALGVRLKGQRSRFRISQGLLHYSVVSLTMSS